jgi:hypothetical protein
MFNTGINLPIVLKKIKLLENVSIASGILKGNDVK